MFEEAYIMNELQKIIVEVIDDLTVDDLINLRDLLLSILQDMP